MSVAAFIAARATKRPDPAQEKADSDAKAEAAADAKEMKKFDSVIKAIEGLGKILTDQAKADAENDKAEKAADDAEDKAEREAMAGVMRAVSDQLTQLVPAIGAAIQAREAQQDAQMKMICDVLCAMKAESAAGFADLSARMEEVETVLLAPMVAVRNAEGQITGSRRVYVEEKE